MAIENYNLHGFQNCLQEIFAFKEYKSLSSNQGNVAVGLERRPYGNNHHCVDVRDCFIISLLCSGDSAVGCSCDIFTMTDGKVPLYSNLSTRDL